MEILSLDSPCVTSRRSLPKPPPRLDDLLRDDPLSPPWVVKSLLCSLHSGRPGWSTELGSVKEMSPLRFAALVAQLLRGVTDRDVHATVLEWADRVKAARVAPSVAAPAQAA